MDLLIFSEKTSTTTTKHFTKPEGPQGPRSSDLKDFPNSHFLGCDVRTDFGDLIVGW